MMLLIPAIIILAAVVGIYMMQAVPRKQLWFGVTLPADAIQDERFKQLRKEYITLYVVYTLIAAAALFPFYWMQQSASLAFVYFIVWSLSMFFLSPAPYRHIHFKAIAIKRAENWFGKQKATIEIEKQLEQLASKRPLPPYWFVLPLIIALPLLYLAANSELPLVRWSGIASLVMTGILFLLNLAFTRDRVGLYSRNPLANMAIHQAARQYWSILWLCMAIFEAINAYVAYFVLSEGTSIGSTLWMCGIFIVSLVPLLSIYYTYHRIRTLEYRYAHTNGKTDTIDEDHYWGTGLVYNNPNDKKVMVPKRIGAGSTVNIATTGGKFVYTGAYALVLAIVIPIAVMIIRADSIAPELTVNEAGTVHITDTTYSFTFETSDIEEVLLEEKMPSGFRVNGIATSEYARGNFKLNELGKAKLYVFKHSSPYIVIKLKDLYVIYNELEPDKTKQVFNELVKHLEK
ncbi:DUF5808 domain-containing protein [Paenibacillus sp. IITD108]|uniref:DUF5808 domain-containing protein n=1 Tax=Paenibacillus sp. IITD108 TaxID=3116649 RepID=UPI002F42037F